MQQVFFNPETNQFTVNPYIKPSIFTGLYYDPTTSQYIQVQVPEINKHKSRSRSRTR